MFDKKEYLRAITSFYFRRGKSAVETTKKIRDLRGDSVVVNERKIQEWFKRLREEDYGLADEKNAPVGLLKSIISKVSKSFTPICNYYFLIDATKIHFIQKRFTVVLVHVLANVILSLFHNKRLNSPLGSYRT